MIIEDRILYEDAEIIAVDKPAGVAVESARVGETDLAHALRSYLADGDGGPEIYTVHRLDQPVAGVVLFARTKMAAAALSKQLADGEMQKIYRARVCGRIPAEAGELTDYLAWDRKTNTAHVVPGGKGSAKTSARREERPKKAVLRYKKTGEDTLEIELITGRHHQIRAQLAHAGMPIRGDTKYGAQADSKEGLARGQIALRAVSLSFRHPRTGAVMRITAEE